MEIEEPLSDEEQPTDEEQEVIEEGMRFEREEYLHYRIYAEKGGGAVELLEVAIPWIARGQAVPKDIRDDLLRYLEKRLLAEKKDNPTDRESRFARRSQIRYDATQIQWAVLLGEKQADALRRFYKKRARVKLGLSFETYKKRIQRQLKLVKKY